MKTFLDIVKEPGYQNYVMEKLARISEDPKYHFPMKFPLLYRYTRIAPYSVDDIINNRITATSIGEFNDLFDGAVHRYGSEEEQLTAAKQRWSEIDHHWQAARLPEGVLKEADYITSYKKHFKNERFQGFLLPFDPYADPYRDFCGFTRTPCGSTAPCAGRCFSETRAPLCRPLPLGR